MSELSSRQFFRYVGGMKKFTRVACIAATALVLSAALPVAAQAAPGSWTAPASVEIPHPDGDGSSLLWRISSAAGTMGHVQRGSGTFGEYGYDTDVVVTQLVCTGQDVTLNTLSFVPNADFDSTTEVDTGDFVATGTGTWAGLDDAVQIRVFGEGDLMRTSHLLTNNTGSPITVTWKMHHDWTDAGAIAHVQTSTGDNVWDASDIWAGAYSEDPGVMVAAFFWATPDLLTNASTAFIDNNLSLPLVNLTEAFSGDQTFNTFTVAPGAKYQLMWFDSNTEAAAETNDARQAALTTAVAEFGDWEWGVHDRSARGIDVTIAGNWREGHYNPQPKTATLPNTGARLDGAWIALGLLVAAGGVFAIRRRVRSVR